MVGCKETIKSGSGGKRGLKDGIWEEATKIKDHLRDSMET